MSDLLNRAPLTLNQAAEDIATRRQQEAVKQFEVGYAELLSPMQGSGLNYTAVIQANGEVSITFSKPGIHDASLVVLPDGKLGIADQKPLAVEEVTTFLANHLLRQEKRVAREAYQNKWRPRYLRALNILAICLLVSFVALFVLVMGAAAVRHASFGSLIQSYPVLWEVFKACLGTIVVSDIGALLLLWTAAQHGISLDKWLE